MLEYDRVDVSEPINTNSTDGSSECIICHYWYLFRINFIFQPTVCDGCYDMRQKFMSFDDSAIVTVRGNYYIINFLFMTKSAAIDRLKNADLSEKVDNYDCEENNYYRDVK